MPDYVGQPKILYEPSSVPYLPAFNDDFSIKRLGSQRYENGEAAYMHFCQIWNIATSATFTRRQGASAVARGVAPEFQPNAEMEIHWTRMDPLKADCGNPDTRPIINYRNGEFGGSGLGVGPLYERFSTGYNNSGTVNLGTSTPVEVEVEEDTDTTVGNFGITVVGNKIGFSNGDWYQIQNAVDYTEVFQGSGTIGEVEVADGTYHVVNLTNGTRTNNLVLPRTTIDNGGNTGGGIVDNDENQNGDNSETFPGSSTEFFITYQEIADRPNGGKVLVPAGRSD